MREAYVATSWANESRKVKDGQCLVGLPLQRSQVGERKILSYTKGVCSPQTPRRGI